MSSPTTASYLHIDGIDIELDIYTPIGVQGALPVVIYFHGGGLVSGARKDLIFPTWKDAVVERNIIFISADYRLLFPCTSFEEIADVKALFTFICNEEKMKAYLPANVTIGTNRIAVSGTSAGGYMARIAAIYATPKPKAVWSHYGMGGDLFLDHWVQPHAEGLVFFDGTTARGEVATLLEYSTPVTANVPLEFISGKVGDRVNRIRLFNWLYQEGTIVDKISGRAGLGETLRALPYRERAAAVPKDVAGVFPQLLLTADFPPTLLTHGEVDTVVPVAESEETFRQLRALGVEVQLTIVPKAEHGLIVPGVFSPDLAEGALAALEEGVAYLAKHLA